MAIVTGWLQDDAHSAADDRHYLDAIAHGVARTLWGLTVTAGPGAMQVSIAPGQGFARDTDGAAESVLVTNDTPLVRTIAAPPVAGEYAVGFRFAAVNESVVSGDIGPFAATTPEVLVLASIALTPSTTTITPAMITDRRKVAPITMIRSGPEVPDEVNGLPDAPNGTLFIQTAPA